MPVNDGVDDPFSVESMLATQYGIHDLDSFRVRYIAEMARADDSHYRAKQAAVDAAAAKEAARVAYNARCKQSRKNASHKRRIERMRRVPAAWIAAGVEVVTPVPDNDYIEPTRRERVVSRLKR